MIEQTAERLPISLDFDAEARVVIDLSYRLGAHGDAEEHHSYSSLLVACMLADNPSSRWFQRRLAELNVEPGAQKRKLGLSDTRLTELARNDVARPLDSATPVVWTKSAQEWLQRAEEFALRRESPTLGACDLVAAFVLARSFHEHDREQMGLGSPHAGTDRGIELANGFLSFILTRFPNQYKPWTQIFRKELAAEPQPDVLAGPATRLASDRWTTDDRLGYRGYAHAIRHFILHPQTEPPLSISIQAPWGAGKTSLMRMIQRELDPEATEAASAGGWKAFRRRRGDDSIVTVRRLLEVVESKPEPVAFDGPPPARYTVWFNAWKYESGDQLWAGLATAIIDQLSDRMAPFHRETFLLRLQASRIDPAKVRRQIHEVAYAKTVNALVKGGRCLAALLPAAAGAAAETRIPGATAIGAVLSTVAGIGQFAITYRVQEKKTEQQPISAVLGDLVSAPDYSQAIGFTHHVVDDLRRVFEVLGQSRAADRQGEPIVVFVDDLDRCSPTKVSAVMEGVNMFLAGDFMPCVFVIGMDPQMVSAALDEAHKDITARLPPYDSKTPLGWRFMDKFIQLPFTIPPPSSARVREYTQHLLQGADVEAIVAEGEQALDRYDPAAGVTPTAIAKQVAEEIAERRNIAQPAADAAARTLRASFALRLQDQMSAGFADTQPIVQEMLAEAIGNFSNNPRDIKRLLNLVRFNYLIGRALIADDQSIPEAEALGRWIALSLRWPAFARWLQWSVSGDGGVAQKLASKTLVERRLKVLEDTASSSSSPDEWQQQVRKEFGLTEKDAPWFADSAFREFFRAGGKPLSAGAGLGFY